MSRLRFAFAIATLVTLFTSCAGRNEDPQPTVATKPDTMQSTIQMDSGTVTVPQPRTNNDPERVNYILASDSTTVVRDGSNLSLTVRGPLGDGCQRFEYYDSTSLGTMLQLTFWASRPTDPNVVCTQQMQYYDQSVVIRNSNYTSFSVVQPDGKTKIVRLSAE